jgi:hypothetical protein
MSVVLVAIGGKADEAQTGQKFMALFGLREMSDLSIDLMKKLRGGGWKKKRWGQEMAPGISAGSIRLF